ncbi:MAG: hypothetical protein LBR25_00710 [Erysipelotrichaceae bacterium]|nr:hypothetical protein [Erysipelotrichaceae bacterium]
MHLKFKIGGKIILVLLLLLSLFACNKNDSASSDGKVDNGSDSQSPNDSQPDDDTANKPAYTLAELQKVLEDNGIVDESQEAVLIAIALVNQDFGISIGYQLPDNAMEILLDNLGDAQGFGGRIRTIPYTLVFSFVSNETLKADLARLVEIYDEAKAEQWGSVLMPGQAKTVLAEEGFDLVKKDQGLFKDESYIVGYLLWDLISALKYLDNSIYQQTVNDLKDINVYYLTDLYSSGNIKVFKEEVQPEIDQYNKK